MNLFDRIREDLGFNPDRPVTPAPLHYSEFVISGVEAWAETALREELDKVRNAAPSNANNQLNSSAFSLGQITAGGHLDPVETFNALLEAALERGQGKTEAVKTIKSGMSSGGKEPRHPKSAEEKEIDAAEEDMSNLLHELLTESQLATLPKPVPVIEGLFYAGSYAWIIGEPNAGKSLFAIDWGQCVARGMPWKGRKVQQGKVLYVVAEGRTGINQRCEAWRKANDQGTSEDILFLPRDVQVTNPLDWLRLIRTVQALNPVMVIMDTQAQCTIGVNENSVQEMGSYIAGVKKMAETTNALVLSVHHVGKDGSIRGTSSVQGAATTVVRCELDDENKEITLYNRREKGGKQKDAAPAEDMHFDLVTHDLGNEESSVTVETRVQITPGTTKVWDDDHEDF